MDTEELPVRTPATIASFLASPGLAEVAAEVKHMRDKGYDIDHDRKNFPSGQIMRAANGYLVAASHVADRIKEGRTGGRWVAFPPFRWPWADEDWKPSKTSTIENLVKAAALITAEIDRRIAEGEE